MVEDTAKKPKVGQGEDSEHVDGELVLSVEKLQELQDELEKVNEEASDKVLEMEQKYNELRKPVYDRRNEIIKSIPDFWLTAFLSHPTLSDVLNEEDQKIFKYIDSLVVEDFKDMKFGFSIHLTFKENPFFENTKLTKTFAIFEDEGTTTVTGTPIKWKEGMGAANGDHETKGNKRSFDDQSFFSWFSEAEQKFFALYSDEVAEVIKEEIWPNPLKYFNNDADEEESDGQEDEENGDDNGDEDDGKEES